MQEQDTNQNAIFQEEQAHLSTTYDKLESLEAAGRALLQQVREDAAKSKEDLAEEVTFDLSDIANQMETNASIESLNRIIDGYNRSAQASSTRLERIEILKKQPYFAKVVLQFGPDRSPRDIYLGTVGMTDEDGRTFIVDWRSPVAETYYNQGNGPMSYEAHGRTIHTDLLLRRQFALSGKVLHSFFDTTVAIEDPLLLKALKHQRTAQMQAITATIQKEQNAVIRHKDVGVLMVRGIAGSGKTSVMLQRIAYLLYTHREDLSPKDVVLITPNPMFAHYISSVLPSLGEDNPQTGTWMTLAKQLGIASGDIGTGPSTSELLSLIDEQCQTSVLRADDCQAVMVDGQTVISAGQVKRCASKLTKVADSKRQCAMVEEDLIDLLEGKIQSEAAFDSTHALLTEMDTSEQIRLFGHPLDVFDEEELTAAGRVYLRKVYEPAFSAITHRLWLNMNKLSRRLLSKTKLSSLEEAYLRLSFAGALDSHARYVMIDEVQDYSLAQIKVLLRCYPQAHFMMLGDPNQAIRQDTASFDAIAQAASILSCEVANSSLRTSYRSSPEITEVFASLADKTEEPVIEPIQRKGTPVTYKEFETAEDKTEALRQLIEQDEINTKGDGNSQSNSTGLRAIICQTWKEAHQLAEDLNHIVSCMERSSQLPPSGTIILDLPLAKGLEFDAVIINDASALAYPADDLHRHRLYTAISRATNEVTVLSVGPFSPLLSAFVNEAENS